MSLAKESVSSSNSKTHKIIKTMIPSGSKVVYVLSIKIQFFLNKAF